MIPIAMSQPRCSRFGTAATTGRERQDEPQDIDDSHLHGILQQLRGLEQLCVLGLAVVSLHPG